MGTQRSTNQLRTNVNSTAVSRQTNNMNMRVKRQSARIIRSVCMHGQIVPGRASSKAVPVSYTHLTLPTICSV
eukprot:9299547-Alexandrium_andersonii.AAC.1